MATQPQMDLFHGSVIKSRDTYGVKYAGSKGRLLSYILGEVTQHSAATVLDGFAGTTRVSQAIARLDKKIVLSDRSNMSKVFGQCFLQFPAQLLGTIKDQVSHLNGLKPVDGWFSECYGGCDVDGRSVGGDGLKKPWMLHNTRKLDAIRPEIEKISENELNRSVLLVSLILALDKVDSTLGHHVSYLDKWATRARGAMNLEVPTPVADQSAGHEVYQEDIFETLDRTNFDLCYFDPPYGSNNEKMPPSRVRYDSYYHLWKTVILDDQPPVFGKACRREDSRDDINPSLFESYHMDADGSFVATNQIRSLIARTMSPTILLSYSSGGRATLSCLLNAIEDAGKLQKMIEIDYRRNVMADMAWTGRWMRDVDEPNREFLFVIKK